MRALSLPLLVACALAVTAAMGTVESGAKLQDDLNAAVRSGDAAFSIRPGTYQFQNIDFLVDTAKNLAITASNSNAKVTLLFACNWGVVLRSCINVSFSNVVVDYDPPCFSQGVVTATKDDGTVRYTVDEKFPTPVSNDRFKAMRIKVINWDPDTQLSITAKPMINDLTFPVKHLEGRSYEIRVGDQPDPKRSNGNIKRGQMITIAPRMGHTVVLTNCSSCTVEGVTVHGASDMALVEYAGAGRNVWRGNRVVRNPERSPMGLLVSNADIFQSIGAEVGPLVEHNEFTHGGDDCMNIHNYFSVVIKRDETDHRRVMLLDAVGEADMTGSGLPWHLRLNTFARVRSGDAARVYDSHNHSLNMDLQLNTTILKVEESTTQGNLKEANDTLKQMGLIKLQMNWVGEVRVYWVTFRDRVPDAALPRALVNVDRLSGGGAVVRHNSLYNCVSVHFKSIGGEVTSNLFNQTGGPSIMIWPPWLEGSVGLRDVRVTDNMFANHQKVYVGPGTSNITTHPNRNV